MSNQFAGLLIGLGLGTLQVSQWTHYKYLDKNFFIINGALLAKKIFLNDEANQYSDYVYLGIGSITTTALLYLEGDLWCAIANAVVFSVTHLLTNYISNFFKANPVEETKEIETTELSHEIQEDTTYLVQENTIPLLVNEN